jgi:hypothetical protein
MKKKAAPRKKPAKTKKPKTGSRKKAELAVAPIGRNLLPTGTADFGFVMFRCYAKSMNPIAAHEECCRYAGLRNTTVEQVERAYREFDKLCQVLARIQQNRPKSKS